MTVKKLLLAIRRRHYDFSRRPEPVQVPLSLSQMFTLERAAGRLGLSPQRLARLLLTAALSETRVELRDDLSASERAVYIQRRQSELDEFARRLRLGLRGNASNPFDQTPPG